ncbi:hypothetical protein K438DRAFT_2133148 [Mycena galopus ATCC 62051]|nr:hypothetical protein K438DRAFT_2133148 [Mycena galopus ATCC 62051]
MDSEADWKADSHGAAPLESQHLWSISKITCQKPNIQAFYMTGNCLPQIFEGRPGLTKPSLSLGTWNGFLQESHVAASDTGPILWVSAVEDQLTVTKVNLVRCLWDTQAVTSKHPSVEEFLPVGHHAALKVTWLIEVVFLQAVQDAKCPCRNVPWHTLGGGQRMQLLIAVSPGIRLTMRFFSLAELQSVIQNSSSLGLPNNWDSPLSNWDTCRLEPWVKHCMVSSVYTSPTIIRTLEEELIKPLSIPLWAPAQGLLGTTPSDVIGTHIQERWMVTLELQPYSWNEEIEQHRTHGSAMSVAIRLEVVELQHWRLLIRGDHRMSGLKQTKIARVQCYIEKSCEILRLKKNLLHKEKEKFNESKVLVQQQKTEINHNSLGGFDSRTDPSWFLWKQVKWVVSGP